jgi:hypothetical protein
MDFRSLKTIKISNKSINKSKRSCWSSRQMSQSQNNKLTKFCKSCQRLTKARSPSLRLKVRHY